MEFNKPVSNPMMVGSIELLKAEDTPEHRQMFLDEMGLTESGSARHRKRCQSTVPDAVHRGRSEVLHGVH